MDPGASRLNRVFNEASELPFGERSSFLERVCGQDREFRERVESLLAAAATGGSFLERPLQIEIGREPVPPVDPEELPGARIGGYEIVARIGEGGFGTVYCAEQREPVRRTVALKVIKLGMDTRRIVARFELERQTLARMDHPGIARIYDAGTTPRGRPFFAMELVQGIPLLEFCDENRLEVRSRLQLFRRILLAIQHAHQKGIIHRDLKPSNILVTHEDGEPTPKVIDFGIAKALDPEPGASLLTEGQQFIGTPQYASPERLAGEEGAGDTRSDIWSLGVILFELLTGTRPIEGERSPVRILDRIREREMPRPSTRVRELSGERADDPPRDGPASYEKEPLSRGERIAARRGCDARSLGRQLAGDLDWIVLKALDRDIERRYGSASEFAEDIARSLADEVVLAGPPSRLYRLRKFVRRNRAKLAAAAALLALLVAGLAGTASGWRRAHRTNQDLLVEQARVVREAEIARRETENALAVLGFVNDDLLAAVAPSEEEGRGRDVLLREVLDVASGRIGLAARSGERFGDKPLVAGSIHLTLGEAYLLLGEHGPAEAHIVAAVEAFRGALGPDEPRTLAARRLHGALLASSGRFAESEAVLEESLAALRRQPGANPRDLVNNLSQLGKTLLQLGRTAEADERLAEATEIAARALPPEDSTALAALSTRGVLERNLGRLDESERTLETVLERRRRVLGPEHVDTLSTVTALANLELRRGRIAEAEARYQEIWEIRSRVQGPEHPSTLVARSNLANIRRRQSRYEEAEAIYREVLEARRRVLGEDDPRTLATLGNLATVLRRQSELVDAEACCREALAGFERTGKADAPEVVDLQSTLVGILMSGRRYEEAELLHREVIAGRERIHGADSIEAATARAALAGLYSETFRSEEAIALGEEALARFRALLDPKDTDIAVVLANLSLAYGTRGDFARARETAAESLSIRREALGDEHRDTLFSTRVLAIAERRSGNLPAARVLVETALPVAEAKLGSRNLVTRDLRVLLGEILLESGDPAAAEPEIRRLLAAELEVHPPGHSRVIEAENLLSRVLGALETERGERGGDGG